MKGVALRTGYIVRESYQISFPLYVSWYYGARMQFRDVFSVSFHEITRATILRGFILCFSSVVTSTREEM
jgi:hypothetical protein